MQFDKPVPIKDEISEPWFEAAARGELLLQRSKGTGEYQLYPRGHALKTLEPDLEWVPASGRGKLHTFSVVLRTANQEFAEDCPYVLAIIELEEGPRMMSRIVETPLDDLRCELPVAVVFRELHDGTAMPYFKGVPE